MGLARRPDESMGRTDWASSAADLLISGRRDSHKAQKRIFVFDRARKRNIGSYKRTVAPNRRHVEE